MDNLEQFGMGCYIEVTCVSQLFIHFFQFQICVTAILVIFKVAFVVYGHIECENGQFGAVWDGL